MSKILFSVIFFVLLFSSCAKKDEKELRIATNSWIGYTPLFYANEKGYLEKLHIKLIPNVSLAEAVDIYSIGKADMVTTTQHEYYSLKNSGKDIVPVILLDRSYGGDMILSNRSVQELANAKKIYAYLEIDSINAEILKDFLKHYNINEDKLIFINKDQSQIQNLPNNKSKATIIVTYSPYNIELKKHGFHEIASTKSMETIIVIDALCTSPKIIKKHPKRLRELKKVIDKSIAELQANKQASYKLVKGYLSNISYGDYVDSLSLIKWINHPSQKLLERIAPMGYHKKDLIQ